MFVLTLVGASSSKLSAETALDAIFTYEHTHHWRRGRTDVNCKHTCVPFVDRHEK